VSDHRDLLERMRALFEEARERGAEDELIAAAHALRSERPASTVAPELPGRFGIVGASPQMEALFDRMERVAPAKVSALIHGDTGTGKELVAKALHEHGASPNKPFFAVNCAAVAANLLESELFGHKRGSFTGAVQDREGHFVAADGGTVFLDEIGDMPLEMQAKLLRVLQDGEVRPVGSNDSRRVDVRVVAASHRDLAGMCAAGEFREDLYYRLNVVTLEVPALAEREGDVAHLVTHFCALLGEELGREISVSAEACAALEAYQWPGNVRELENELRRAAVLSQGMVQQSDLREELLGG
jgi:transcriptional regulator with GAF, ATPase, and Fis domain